MPPLAIIAISIMACALLGSMRYAAKAYGRVLELEDSIRKLTRERVSAGVATALAADLMRQRDALLSAPPRLDSTTEGLVRLATSNPNENEATQAAMIVCKRLREKLR